jgi:hypothetical protein
MIVKTSVQRYNLFYMFNLMIKKIPHISGVFQGWQLYTIIIFFWL